MPLSPQKSVVVSLPPATLKTTVLSTLKPIVLEDGITQTTST